MKLFYICLIFVVLAMTAVQADYKADLKNLAKVCEQEVPTTQEDLEKFFKGGMDPANANDAIKCHIKCVLEKQGVFTNGSFNEESFLKTSQNIPALKDRQAEVLKAAGECKKESGANDCETAFKILMCLKANKAAVMGN